MTIEEEKKAAAEKEAKRRETLERGAAILSQPDNFKNIVSGAVSALQKTSEEKGKFGESDKLSAEDRSKRRNQDSENRRVAREAKRLQATGRTSNWLKRYAERKTSEFNTQNASFQQTPQQSSSISYQSLPSASTAGLSASRNESPLQQPLSTTDQSSHPWKIYKTTSNNVTQVKIEYNSKVYSGTGSYDNIAVTGLDSWTQAETGYVVLKGSVSNHEITSLSIVWGDDGSTQRAEFNSNNEQTDVTIRLGYIYQDENDAWQIRQDVFGQLTIITTCYQTKPCLCFIQT